MAVLAQLVQPLFEGDAAVGNQPVGGSAHVLGEQGQDLFVVLVGAIGLEVGNHRLHGVVSHAVVDLQLRAHDHLVAAGHGDGAAQEAGLLHQDDALAQLGQTGSGSHTGSAAAHHDHIGGQLLGFLLTGRGGSVLQSLHVTTGLGHSVGHGLQDGIAGDGGTGDGVHGQALVFHNGGGNVFNGTVADPGGLGMLHDLHGIDGIGGEGDLHLHVAVLTGGSPGIGAGGVDACFLTGSGGGGSGLLGGVSAAGSQPQNHHKSQKQGQSTFHVAFLLFLFFQRGFPGFTGEWPTSRPK